MNWTEASRHWESERGYWEDNANNNQWNTRVTNDNYDAGYDNRWNNRWEKEDTIPQTLWRPPSVQEITNPKLSNNRIGFSDESGGEVSDSNNRRDQVQLNKTSQPKLGKGRGRGRGRDWEPELVLLDREQRKAGGWKADFQAPCPHCKEIFPVSKLEAHAPACRQATIERLDDDIIGFPNHHKDKSHNHTENPPREKPSNYSDISEQPLPTTISNTLSNHNPTNVSALLNTSPSNGLLAPCPHCRKVMTVEEIEVHATACKKGIAVAEKIAERRADRAGILALNTAHYSDEQMAKLIKKGMIESHIKQDLLGDVKNQGRSSPPTSPYNDPPRGRYSAYNDDNNSAILSDTPYPVQYNNTGYYYEDNQSPSRSRSSGRRIFRSRSAGPPPWALYPETQEDYNDNRSKSRQRNDHNRVTIPDPNELYKYSSQNNTRRYPSPPSRTPYENPPPTTTYQRNYQAPPHPYYYPQQYHHPHLHMDPYVEPPYTSPPPPKHNYNENRAHSPSRRNVESAWEEHHNTSYPNNDYPPTQQPTHADITNESLPGWSRPSERQNMRSPWTPPPSGTNYPTYIPPTFPSHPYENNRNSPSYPTYPPNNMYYPNYEPTVGLQSYAISYTPQGRPSTFTPQGGGPSTSILKLKQALPELEALVTFVDRIRSKSATPAYPEEEYEHPPITHKPVRAPKHHHHEEEEEEESYVEQRSQSSFVSPRDRRPFFRNNRQEEEEPPRNTTYKSHRPPSQRSSSTPRDGELSGRSEEKVTVSEPRSYQRPISPPLPPKQAAVKEINAQIEQSSSRESLQRAELKAKLRRRNRQPEDIPFWNAAGKLADPNLERRTSSSNDTSGQVTPVHQASGDEASRAVAQTTTKVADTTVVEDVVPASSSTTNIAGSSGGNPKCPVCGKSFPAQRLPVHVSICTKVHKVRDKREKGAKP